MLAGDPYHGPDAEAGHAAGAGSGARVQRDLAGETARRWRVLSELVGSLGEGTEIRPPFYCEYGYQTHIVA